MVLTVGAMTVFHLLRMDRMPGGLGSKLGVVEIEGVIADVRDELDFIEELQENDAVIGVLLRVDSPGGSVVPSQELYAAVKRLAEAKPVVVSMGSLAASGGYYLSAPADKIFANRGTLTGSIGVRMDFSNFEELMGKVGVDFFSVISGRFKDSGSPFKPFTPEERAYFQELVEDLHSQFIHDVAEARGMDLERVQELADGKVLTGRQAYDLGLVDELGGRKEALEALKVLCKVPGQDLPLIEGPKKDEPLLQRILASLGVPAPSNWAWSPRISFLLP